ncbi:FAD-binding protein [Chloroflexota bacterium]
MLEETVESDVLCIGGGIAGLMAAIQATEHGAKVIVADKANTMRSGAGSTGNDHFRCYIPELHGPDIQPVVEELMHSQVGGSRSRKFITAWMQKSFDIVKLWDSWGIPMKVNGKWEFFGHAFPGRPFTTLKYAGQQQKPILTKKARKRGVQIINRVMVYDLLCDDGNIIGAIGVNTREEKVITFRAKSVILCTGICTRLYPSPTPGWMFNRADPPSTTGDGRAMAYHAGAELFNMELPKRWAGAKYFSRCGKGTWIGVVRDPQDKAVGPFVNKPDRIYGDAIADFYHNLFEDYTKSGRAPVYMDCRGISDEDSEYMMWGLTNEGNIALLNHMKEEGIDIRKNAVEFMTYELRTGGGVFFNEKAETSVGGLYAAGDEYFAGISGAATFGWIAGDNAARYAEKAQLPDADRVKKEIEKKKDLLDEIRSRKTGAGWKEVNIALEQIMQDYVGTIRSETMLEAGLNHLRRLKEKANNTMIARNQHELMHCLEVLNLLDMGELVFVAARERKETRGTYVRPDYPFTNPLLNNKQLIVKKVGENPIAEWQEINR